jgi:diaminopimelate epimerase
MYHLKKGDDALTVNMFAKFHGIGNDYIVFDEDNIRFRLTPSAIRRICDVHFGVGSDGILLKTRPDKTDFGLRTLIPTAGCRKKRERLRTFAKYLYELRICRRRDYTGETPGRRPRARPSWSQSGKGRARRRRHGQAIFKAADSRYARSGMRSSAKHSSCRTGRTRSTASRSAIRIASS